MTRWECCAYLELGLRGDNLSSCTRDSSMSVSRSIHSLLLDDKGKDAPRTQVHNTQVHKHKCAHAQVHNTQVHAQHTGTCTTIRVHRCACTGTREGFENMTGNQMEHKAEQGTRQRTLRKKPSILLKRAFHHCLQESESH